MTLDEAIKVFEEGMHKNLCKHQEFAFIHDEDGAFYHARLAEEHAQMAEWLKELKILMEQEPFMNKPCVAHQICHEDKVKALDKIRAEILRHSYEGFELGGFMDGYYTAMAKVLDIIARQKAEGEEE